VNFEPKYLDDESPNLHEYDQNIFIYIHIIIIFVQDVVTSPWNSVTLQKLCSISSVMRQGFLFIKIIFIKIVLQGL